jgi:hypothetical protein
VWDNTFADLRAVLATEIMMMILIMMITRMMIMMTILIMMMMMMMILMMMMMMMMMMVMMIMMVIHKHASLSKQLYNMKTTPLTNMHISLSNSKPHCAV